MNISLAGPSYTALSVVAAAQQTMNLIPEPVEVPNEPTKLTLYGRPGLTHFSSLVPTKIRAMWAGGGRLFVIHGNTESEVHQDGSAVPSSGTVAQGTGSPDPAQIFSNGHQLLIVSGGYAYCDNGSGPQQLFFAVSALGNTFNFNGSLVRTDGPPYTPPFTGAYTGMAIVVDGQDYLIAGVPNDHTLLLNPTPPDATGITWQMPNPPNGDPVTAVTGGILDDYFIVNRVPVPQTATDPGRQFAISNLNNGLIWDPLDFGVKEGHSDYIRSILCDSEELWLFGTETIEVWANNGDPNFPFARIPGAFIHQGSVATYAPCSVGLTVCWLAGGPEGQTVAWQAQGMQPRRISTYAQESAWNSPGFTVSDAVSYGYSDGGHTYWVINFWSQNKTWVYDLNTGLWHERAAWDGTNFTRYQPWFHAFVPEWGVGGMHIVGDPGTGYLYQMATTLTSDNTAPIAYQRAFPHLINENQFAYHHRLELYLESGTFGGVGLVPYAELAWSDDRGHTFGPARALSMGATGAYTQRLVARRLGKARDRVYRVHIESIDKVALVDAFLEVTPGFA